MSLAFSVACLCGIVVYDVIVGAIVATSLALFSITMHGGQLCPDSMPLIVFYRLTALLQCASEDGVNISSLHYHSLLIDVCVCVCGK